VLTTRFLKRERRYIQPITFYILAFNIYSRNNHNKMYSCGHEHHDHGDQAHDHSDDITPALQHSLYSQINFDHITALNESIPGAGKAIVKKTWDERLSEETELCSDCDEQLLIHIPYVLTSN